MKPLLQKILLLAPLLIASLSIHAANDTELRLWVKNTLLNTLTVDYHYQESEDAKLSQGYTRNAWIAITQFLGGYMDVILQQKLSIHPVFLQEPTVVDSGVINGIHYWRVNEVVSLPELHSTIAFSLVVLAKVPTKSGPFIIQSMDMVKQEY